MRGGDCFRLNYSDEADLRGAGIYRWTAGGLLYVGKASNLRSRLNEYLNNIRKIEKDLPYRKGRPDGFRTVHRFLAQAKAKGQVIEWDVLEYCAKGEALVLRERYWIERLQPQLNGPRRTFADERYG